MKPAPQASVRAEAARVSHRVQGVDPTPTPEAPSAFDFAGDECRDENEEGGFNFA
jgi:hypothetical protein